MTIPIRARGAWAGAIAAAVLGSATPAFAQEAELGEPWNQRPMVAPPRHFEGTFGFAYGQNPDSPASNEGAALGADANIGIVRGLQISAGFGLRFSRGAGNSGAERYVRVNDEWVPADHISVGDPNLDMLRTRNEQFDRANGDDAILANPYFRIRYAPLNDGPVMLGFEFNSNAPLVPGTCWAPGAGVPLHVRFGHDRFRIESGFFHQFLLGGPCAAVDTYMYVPFRFNIQVVPRFWFGVRSGLELWQYSFDTNHYYIPLGAQGGVRIIRQLDIVFDVVFPEFIHATCEDAGCNRSHNVFFNVWGFGVGALIRLPG